VVSQHGDMKGRAPPLILPPIRCSYEEKIVLPRRGYHAFHCRISGTVSQPGDGLAIILAVLSVYSAAMHLVAVRLFPWLGYAWSVLGTNQQ